MQDFKKNRNENGNTEITDHSQTADQLIREADRLIKSCSHVELCSAQSSSYVILGDERASPRGRIKLIAQMLTNGGTPSKGLVQFIDNAFACLPSTTQCSCGHDYRRLIHLARTRINSTNARTLSTRLLYKTLLNLLTRPKRLKAACMAQRFSHPLVALTGRLGAHSITTMLSSIPRHTKGNRRLAAKNPAIGKKIKRVALFTNEIDNILYPSLYSTTVSLLTCMGVEVLVPAGIGSCGAVEYQLGAEKRLIKAAKHNVDLLTIAHQEQPLDAIVTTSSRCGAVLKEYGYLLRNEEGYAKRAQDLSNLTQDITELLDSITMLAPRQWSDIKVAYHGSGALENWQQVSTQPRSLLKQAGYDVLEIPQGHLSCGAGGIYNMLQPDISKALQNRMLDNIDKIQPDIIVVSDITCLNHLSPRANIPVVHTVELLNWAYGGECPAELKHLEERIQKISGVMADSRGDEYN